MSMRILLLSPEGEKRQVYCNELNKVHIQFDIVDTFRELYDSMAKKPYNGIVLDLSLKLRSPKEEMNLVQDILQKFPVAELRLNPKTKEIGLYYQGQHKDGGNLDDFANRICRLFDARRISTEKRIGINLSVMLARKNDFREGNIEKTITIDASEGGCFIFSNDKWEINEDAWVIIKGLSDQTPIRGKVCWSVEWGGIQLPGIGIKYQEIKETQLNEILRIGSVKGRGMER